jgi:histidine triad (HIT) family protein
VEKRAEYCVFCEIIAGNEKGTVRYEDNELIVFDNQLHGVWVPVMLLVVPKKHYTQEEFWTSAEFGAAARVAVEMGNEHCPDGFRLISNVGLQGMQSQDHGHIHMIGGTYLGMYAYGQIPYV